MRMRRRDSRLRKKNKIGEKRRSTEEGNIWKIDKEKNKNIKKDLQWSWRINHKRKIWSRNRWKNTSKLKMS